jgi:hypothetical protein
LISTLGLFLGLGHFVYSSPSLLGVLNGGGYTISTEVASNIITLNIDFPSYLKDR